MKFPLSLHRDYVPDWSVEDAIRELYQEYRDAATEGHWAQCKYLPGSEKFRIKIDDKVLPRESLLQGFSTKRGNEKLVGEKGEGYKLALLVLTREGYEVWIKTGDEIWRPRFEISKQFGAETLVIEVTKTKSPYKGTQVEVRGISPDSWEAMRHRFLDMADVDEDKVVSLGNGGRVLLGERFCSKLYVGGIFVQDLPDKYTCGFDFSPEYISLDRDRKSADVYDVRYRVKDALRVLLNNEVITPQKAYELLESGEGESKAFEYEFGASEFGESVSAYFEERYGDAAIPVSSLTEAKELEHYGKRGVVVNKSIIEVIESNRGSYTARKEAFDSKYEIVQLHDLTDEEKEVFFAAHNLIHDAIGLDGVNVVAGVFSDDRLLGTCKGSHAEIALSREALADFPTCLRILVHEAAHLGGGEDASRTHKEAEIDIYIKMVDGLRRSRVPK